MKDVNFIPQQRRLRQQWRRRACIWAGVCGAWVGLLAVALGAAHAMYSVDDTGLSVELATLEERLTRDHETIRSLNDELQAARSALVASRSTGEQPDWSVLLKMLARQTGDDVVLDSCDLSAEGAGGNGRPADDGPHVPIHLRRFRLTISGFGRTQDAVSRFVLGLERTELFTEVKLLTSNRGAFYKGKAVSFQLECAL